jgi:acyl-CoA thioester hydrolase
MPPEDPRVKETSFRVRFAETDLMGVAHHASYVVYFEVGRVDFTRQAGAPYSELEALGYSLAVSELNLRYVTAARFDQLITVRTWLAELRSRTITFGYEIVDCGTRQLLATGSARLICIDHKGQVRRIPRDWLDAMRPLALNSEPPAAP